MIKLFAIILTVSSGVFMGNTISRCELSKINEAEELHSLLSQIMTGIEKFSLPLADIFSKYVSSSGDTEASKIIASTRGSFGDKIMALAKEACSPLLCMEIKEFTQTLGLVDRDTQIKLTRNAMQAMEKELSQKRAEYISKSKLYKTLSLLVSCVIAVLLY